MNQHLQVQTSRIFNILDELTSNLDVLLKVPSAPYRTLLSRLHQTGHEKLAVTVEKMWFIESLLKNAQSVTDAQKKEYRSHCLFVAKELHKFPALQTHFEKASSKTEAGDNKGYSESVTDKSAGGRSARSGSIASAGSGKPNSFESEDYDSDEGSESCHSSETDPDDPTKKINKTRQPLDPKDLVWSLNGLTELVTTQMLRPKEEAKNVELSLKKQEHFVEKTKKQVILARQELHRQRQERTQQITKETDTLNRLLEDVNNVQSKNMKLTSYLNSSTEEIESADKIRFTERINQLKKDISQSQSEHKELLATQEAKTLQMRRKNARVETELSEIIAETDKELIALDKKIEASRKLNNIEMAHAEKLRRYFDFVSFVISTAKYIPICIYIPKTTILFSRWSVRTR